MKKIKILSFASLPLAMALLAGCGHQHTFSEEWNHDANKHWHDATCEHKDQVSEEGEHVFGDDNICDVCGYDKGGEPGPGPGPGPGPQPEIDHTVTAEEWLAFWDTSKPFYIADNYKATMVMTADGQSGSQTSVMTVDGNKAKFEGLIDGVAAQLDYCEFISKGNYKHYEYDKTAEKWYYEVGSNNPADDFAMQLQPFFTMTGFTYDEASKSYKKESSGTYSNLVIQFGAKKVTSYSFNFLMPVGPGVTMPVKMEGTFDYNGQVVTLPEPAEPAHVHNYNQLKYDEYSHWNACECGEREPYSGGPHYDADWDCKCDVCEYAMPVEVEPGYYMLMKEGGYSSLEENLENPGEFMQEMYFDEGTEFSLFNVTDSAYNRFSELTLSDDEKTSATGVTISEGVVTIHETANYRFYLNPTYNEGKGILYVAKDEGPLPSEPVYGYKINDGEYITMDLDGKDKSAQWIAIGVDVEEGQTVTFANITPDTPETMPGLYIGGTTQGFTILDGVLTADHTGNYNFYLQPEFENDVVYIAENSVVDCRLMGMNDDWEGGILMSPVSEGSTEFVAQNLDIEPGDKVKVKFEDNWISDYKRNTGTANALDENLAVIDGEGNVQFNFAGVYTVYFESNTEGAYGVFVRRESVSCPYVGSADMTTPSGDIHQDATFFFHKVDLANNFIEYYLSNCPGYNGMSYTIKDGDTPVDDFELEESAEKANFTKVGSTITYHGTADALNFYLKEDLTDHSLKVYVEAYVDPTQYNTLYLDAGVWEADGAIFCAYFFDSTSTNPELWVMLEPEDGLYKVNKVEGYDKVIFVRCDPAKDPLIDHWDAKWNQTQDLDVPTDSYVKCSITGWGEEKQPSPSTWQVK